MRREDDIVELPEGVIRWQRLGLENVRRGAAISPAVRAAQIVQTHDGAEADVNQVRVSFHQAKLLATRTARPFRACAARDHDVVALASKPGSWPIGHGAAMPVRGSVPRIDRNEPILAPADRAADFGPDTPQAHDASVTPSIADARGQRRFQAGAILKPGTRFFSAHWFPDAGFLLTNVGVQIPGEARDIAQRLVGDAIIEQAAHVSRAAEMRDQFGKQIMFHAGRGGLNPTKPLRTRKQFGRHAPKRCVGVLISRRATASFAAFATDPRRPGRQLFEWRQNVPARRGVR